MTTTSTSPDSTITGSHQPISEHSEFRLDIVTGPDPDDPTAIVFYRADGIAAAIAQARLFLAAHHGPDNRYGELYQRNSDLADYLTDIHLGV